MSIAIYGAGGFGREARQIIYDCDNIDDIFAGFVVDDEFKTEQNPNGIEWINRENQNLYMRGILIVVAIGSPSARKRIVQKIHEQCKKGFGGLIHPRALIGDNVEIGEGSIVCAGAMITTDIEIGSHVHINLNATIGHDTKIGDFVTISPGVNISGNVTIKEGAEIGTGAVIIPGCTIGKWSVVGAGSVVITDVPDNSTAVGNPAKVIKQREDGWQNQAKEQKCKK